MAIRIHLGAPSLLLVGIIRSPDKSHLESDDAKNIHKNYCLRLLVKTFWPPAIKASLETLLSVWFFKGMELVHEIDLDENCNGN